MGIVIIFGYLVEQAARLEVQEASLYEFRTQADEQKAQMIAMEEIHALNERNRISRDLHDTVGRTLSTIVIQLAAIEN